MLLAELKKVKSIKRDGNLLTGLLNVFSLAVKIQDNVTEIIKLKGADILVEKLFTFLSEDVNEDQQKLIDQVINILEVVVVHGSNIMIEEGMEVDTDKQKDNKSILMNVSIIIDKIVNACEHMVEWGKGIQNTSEQIVAISKILPFLTNKNKEAETKIADLFIQNVKNLHMISEVNQRNFKWEEKFRVEFYLRRLLNCLESGQNHMKDTFADLGIADDLCTYISKTLTSDLMKKESELMNFDKPLSLAFECLAVFLKTNTRSQEKILAQNKQSSIINSIFKLSRTKLQERKLSILAESVIDSLTFPSDLNNKETFDFVKSLVEEKENEKRKKALKKKKAMLLKMKKPGKALKTKALFDQIKEEKGIKCIICQEGYQSKDQDLLGIYVFVKKIVISPDKATLVGEENGYTTVTHFN